MGFALIVVLEMAQKLRPFSPELSLPGFLGLKRINQCGNQPTTLLLFSAMCFPA